MNGFSTEFLRWVTNEIDRSGLILRYENFDRHGFRFQILWDDPINMLFGVTLPEEI